MDKEKRNRIEDIIIKYVWIYVWIVIIVIGIFFTIKDGFWHILVLSIMLGWMWPLPVVLVLGVLLGTILLPFWILCLYQAICNYIDTGKFKPYNKYWVYWFKNNEEE